MNFCILGSRESLVSCPLHYAVFDAMKLLRQMMSTKISLLRCDIVQTGRNLPMFRKNVLIPILRVIFCRWKQYRPFRSR